MNLTFTIKLPAWNSRRKQHSLFKLYLAINIECQPKSTLNYLFIQHVFIECLHLPGTILGSRSRTVNKTDKPPCPHAANFLLRETKNK